MTNRIALSAVDGVFEPRPGQTKNYKIDIRKLKLISLSLKRLVITNVKCSTIQMFGQVKPKTIKLVFVASPLSVGAFVVVII